MNASEIYQEAIHGQEDDSTKQQEEKEQKEERELRYLNFNMQATTLEVRSAITKRINSLNEMTEKLSQREGTSFEINKYLQEKATLNKVIELIKTGDYKC